LWISERHAPSLKMMNSALRIRLVARAADEVIVLGQHLIEPVDGAAICQERSLVQQEKDDAPFRLRASLM
jgi:hypothetical protein